MYRIYLAIRRGFHLSRMTTNVWGVYGEEEVCVWGEGGGGGGVYGEEEVCVGGGRGVWGGEDVCGVGGGGKYLITCYFTQARIIGYYLS